MTDHSLPDDEILSSYLDGEATPAEVARVDADPGLRARLEELRAAADLVATPVSPLPSADADRLIAAALEASGTSESVIDLGAEAARRASRRQRLVTIAAGVLVIGLAVPVLVAINSAVNDSDTDTTSVATDAPGGDSADEASSGLDFADASADDEGGGTEMFEAELDAAPDAVMDEQEAADEPADTDAELMHNARADFALPGALGPYANETELIDELEAIWRERDGEEREEPLSTATTTTAFRALPCGEVLLDFYNGLEATDVRVDLTVVEIDGLRFTVALGSVDDTTGIPSIADHADCAVRQLGEFED